MLGGGLLGSSAECLASVHPQTVVERDSPAHVADQLGEVTFLIVEADVTGVVGRRALEPQVKLAVRDTGERQAMEFADTVLGDGVVMDARRVADVAVEAILRVAIMEADHQPITRHLGDDGGGGDRRGASVAAAEGFVGHREAWQSESVDKNDVRHGQDCPEGRFESGEIAAMEAVAIDGVLRAAHDGDLLGAVQDLTVEKGALRLAELLRVVESGQRREVGGSEVGVVEADCGGDQRAGKGATACLVGAGQGAAGTYVDVEGEARVAGGLRAAPRDRTAGRVGTPLRPLDSDPPASRRPLRCEREASSVRRSALRAARGAPVRTRGCRRC
jgi:hypothetical protein